MKCVQVPWEYPGGQSDLGKDVEEAPPARRPDCGSQFWTYLDSQTPADRALSSPMHIAVRAGFLDWFGPDRARKGKVPGRRGGEEKGGCGFKRKSWTVRYLHVLCRVKGLQKLV